MAFSKPSMEQPVYDEFAIEHLGRTGAATPPPSAPRMLSYTARGMGMRVGSAKTLTSFGAASSSSMTSSMKLFASTGAASMRRTSRESRVSFDGRPPTVANQMGDSSYSSALPSTWRKTWTEAGAFPSPTLRRAEEVSGPGRDLSTPARRANRKAAEKMHQCNTAQQTVRRGNPNDTGGTDASGYGRSFSGANVLAMGLHGTSKDWEQSFKEDAVEVDSLIQSLASNLRLGGVKNQKEREAEQEAKMREEQRRQRAAAEKAARLQEAAARDPHRKVNLKIENTRKFKLDAVEEMGVPMLQVQFNGSSGMEHVNMVDCLKLRQRCKQIDTGQTPSVHSLIEEQTRLDRLYGLDPKTGVKCHTETNVGDAEEKDSHTSPGLDQSPHSRSEPSLRGSRGDVPARSNALDEDEESKWARVSRNRSTVFVSTLLRKLNNMRSTPTEATLANLEYIAAHGAMDASAVGMKHLSFASAEFDKSTELLRKQIEQTRSGALAAQKKSQTCAKKPKVRVELDEKGHQRAQHAWGIARSAVCVLVLYYHIKKKQKCVAIVGGFLATLGEWSRVRLSMSRLLKSVYYMQRASRQYIATKRKRTEIMSKEWQRVEDHHLQIHFKEVAQIALEEIQRQEELARAKGRVVQHRSEYEKRKQEDMFKMMKENVDWKMYKIPREDRRSILSRYYYLQLKKKVQGRKNLLETVQNVVKLHNETVGFLKQFGADESHAADLKSMSLQRHQVVHEHAPEFWHLTDDKALDLIAFAAHSLRGKKPWRDHPANMHRQVKMRRPHLKLGTNPDLLCLIGETQPRVSKRGKNSKNEAESHNAENHNAGASDLDQLWQQFTPRLREVTKEEGMNKPSSRTSQRPMSRLSNRLGVQEPVSWRT